MSERAFLRSFFLSAALFALSGLLGVSCTDRDDDNSPTDAAASSVPVPASAPEASPTRAVVLVDTETDQPNKASKGSTEPQFKDEREPRSIVDVDYISACGLSLSSYGGFYDASFLGWHSQDDFILFSDATKVGALDIEADQLLAVAELGSNSGVDKYPLYGLGASLSPSGEDVVYSTCEYGEDTSYEVARIGIDGQSRQRLTNNQQLDHFPVWSSDGRKIAYLSERQMQEGPDRLSLLIMDSDGSNVKWVPTPPDLLLDYKRPVWSPDDQRIAFFARAFDRPPHSNYPRFDLYTIRTDGTGLARLGVTTTHPVWSSDGKELWFATLDVTESLFLEEGYTKERRDLLGTAAIHAAAADGTAHRTVWRSERLVRPMPVVHMSFSPSGTELLFVFHGVRLVNVDGANQRTVYTRWNGGIGFAEWAPDGSSIAVFYPCDLTFGPRQCPSVRLLTMAVDGTDIRPLVVQTANGRPRLAYPTTPTTVVDNASCSTTEVVPNPQVNVGLVRDCKILLDIRSDLAGSGNLNWNERSPIGQWSGVQLSGTPIRVTGLSLRGLRVTGTLPPALGKLTALQELVISGLHDFPYSFHPAPEPGNRLRGNIPPELANLAQLERLDLSGNYLTGPIPPEVGALKELRLLDLGSNSLTGPIPRELGNLSKLEYLTLSNNHLNGKIPPELSNARALTVLDLRKNLLKGEIPVEFSKLSALSALMLGYNFLTGTIPAEVSSLTKLTEFDLSNNQLTGEIPPSLVNLKQLQYLALSNNSLDGCVPVGLPVYWGYMDILDERFVEPPRLAPCGS